MSDPERILIVRLSHLGDVVCALGVVHALHAAFPTSEIAWAVQTEFADLLKGLPGLRRVLRFEREGGLPTWAHLVGQVRRFAPDLVVDVQGNLKSASITLASGASRRVGLARADWRERLGAFAVNERAAACGPDERHAVDRSLALVRHLAPETLPLRTDPGLSPVELARGEALFDEHAPAGKRGVVLHLSSVEDVRGWPLERWSELLRGLREAGRACLVLSGPNEVGAGTELAQRHPDEPGLRHWIGQASLRDLAACFTVAARRGWRLIACDSGPMHLAWAAGMSVVVLEGPQDGGRTGPWPARGEVPHRIVQSAEPPPCAPCYARSCTHPGGPVCMSAITASDVLAAFPPST